MSFGSRIRTAGPILAMAGAVTLGSGGLAATPAAAASDLAAASAGAVTSVENQSSDDIACQANALGPFVRGIAGSYSIGVAGSAQCTGPVVSLDIVVVLYRNGRVWASSSALGSSSAAAIATGPCVDGVYDGETIARVVLPADHEALPENPISVSTGSVYVDCP